MENTEGFGYRKLIAYQKAKDDICYWITDEWYSFDSPMQKEIESAYQTALKKKDDLAIG